MKKCLALLFPLPFLPSIAKRANFRQATSLIWNDKKITAQSMKSPNSTLTTSCRSLATMMTEIKTNALSWEHNVSIQMSQVCTNILRSLRTVSWAFVEVFLWPSWRVSASNNCCMLTVQYCACLFRLFKVIALIQWSVCTVGEFSNRVGSCRRPS